MWQLSCLDQLGDVSFVGYETDRISQLHLEYEFVRRQRLVICCGAGVDSTTAVYYALKARSFMPEDVTVLHINYGAPYYEKELAAYKAQTKRFDSIGVAHSQASVLDFGRRLPHLDARCFPKGYIIPCRNGLLAAIGSLFGDEVWVVANYRQNDGDVGAAIDKNRRFYGEITEILSRAHKRPITVASPFLHLSKGATIAWLISEYGQTEAAEILKGTVSCYSALGGRCGDCYACYKAYKAFDKYGLTTLLKEFESNPLMSARVSEWGGREKAKGRDE
jgi:7-cyano-7-deazaguanine synthase in queuosine biosynthesis